MTSNVQIAVAWRKFERAEEDLYGYLQGRECDCERQKVLSAALIAATDSLLRHLTVSSSHA